MAQTHLVATQLAALQQIDQRLARLSRRHYLLLRAVERAEKLRVVWDQLVWEQLHQTKLAHERLSDLSWELEDLEQRLRELEGQGPGSGDVLLDREVMRLRQRQDLLEGHVLEQMLQTDELDRDMVQERTRLARRTLHHTQHVQRLQRLVKRVEQRLTALDAQRETLVLQLPPLLLERYEDLRVSTQNSPVARVYNGRCAMCGCSPVERQGWLICSGCERLLILE